MGKLQSAVEAVRDRKFYYFYTGLLRLLFKLKRHDGIAVMEEDWDNLLVLDACRYDVFKEVNTVPGTLEKVESQATSTPQWLERNFPGTYDDVVYVAGNPYVAQLDEEGFFDAEQHFHHVEHVWDEGWDEDVRTVPPEAMNEAVRDVRDRFPDKRIIAHYMQPHEPFIGEPNFQDVRDGGFQNRKEYWKDPRIEEAYRANLEIVLDAVKDILPELDGTVVITGDHGEAFRETLGIWRHPRGVFIPELVEVPWFEVEQGSE